MMHIVDIVLIGELCHSGTNVSISSSDVHPHCCKVYPHYKSNGVYIHI